MFDTLPAVVQVPVWSRAKLCMWFNISPCELIECALLYGNNCTKRFPLDKFDRRIGGKQSRCFLDLLEFIRRQPADFKCAPLEQELAVALQYCRLMFDLHDVRTLETEQYLTINRIISLFSVDSTMQSQQDKFWLVNWMESLPAARKKPEHIAQLAMEMLRISAIPGSKMLSRYHLKALGEMLQGLKPGWFAHSQGWVPACIGWDLVLVANRYQLVLLEIATLLGQQFQGMVDVSPIPFIMQFSFC